MSNQIPDPLTEFVASGRSRLEIRSGQIKLVLELPLLKQGIIPFLNQYVQLYYGKFHRDIVVKKFLSTRSEVIKLLQTLPLCSSLDWQSFDVENYKPYQSVAFRMYMCRIAQTQNWSFPAVCQNGNWDSGMSRCFASGMCSEQPWLKLYGLEIINKNQSSKFLEDPVLIDSDCKLHNILNLKFDNNSIDATISLKLIGEQIVFQYLINDFNNGNNPNCWNLWDQFASWRQQYPTKPKIKIYTNWPKQIYNQFDAWDVVEVMSSQHIIDEIRGFGGRTGRLERFATEEHNNPKEPVEYVLYVIDPRPIELGDLLVWMDMEHNAYIESEWKFLLYKKADIYKTTYIDTSYIMQ